DSQRSGSNGCSRKRSCSMLAEHIAYVALVSSDPAATAGVLERHFGLARHNLASSAGPVPVFPLGHSALAVFAQGHPLVEGEGKPGVHHIGLAVADCGGS